MKKRSWSGLIGLVMLIVGAKLFFSSTSEDLPPGIVWLVGSMLWYGAFIFVCYWFLQRILFSRATGSEKGGRSGERLRVVSRKTFPKTGTFN
jgi:hypothetical protein